ncbi:MAG: hypothetical protein J6O15_05260, partial [Acinetobacter sp.]|nr:hypothetical protein [Acinetobacter sp.]
MAGEFNELASACEAVDASYSNYYLSLAAVISFTAFSPVTCQVRQRTLPPIGQTLSAFTGMTFLVVFC